MKFKVGQIVELIDNKEWKRDSKWHNQGDGGYYPKDFKLVIRKGEQLLFSFMEQDA